MSRSFHIGAALAGLFFAGLCPGKEVFYLRSGFSLQAQSHVRQITVGSDIFRLTTGSGTIELSAAEVDRIETIADPSPEHGGMQAGQPVCAPATQPDRCIGT